MRKINYTHYGIFSDIPIPGGKRRACLVYDTYEEAQKMLQVRKEDKPGYNWQTCMCDSEGRV